MNVTNETNEKGAVLCVVCGKPATWQLAGGVRYTSPMRRVRVRFSCSEMTPLIASRIMEESLPRSK